MSQHRHYAVYQALALLVAPMLAGGAAAMGVGELRVHSYVGQRLRASIPLQLAEGEVLNETCLQFSGGSDELPSPGPITARIQAGSIMLQTDDTQTEPTSTFTLRINCGRLALDRNYMVMLDPAPLGESAPVVTSAPAADVLPIKPDETQLVKTERKRAQSQTVPLAAPAAPTAEAVAPLAPPPAKRSKKTINKDVPSNLLAGIGEQTRLYIDGGGDVPRAAPLPAPGTPEYSAQLEQRVATLQSLQGKLEADIADLQRTLATLHQQSDTIDSRAAAAAAAIVPAASTAATANAAPTLAKPHPVVRHPLQAPAPVAEEHAWPWWLLALLGIGVIAGVALWWWRRRSVPDFDTQFDADALLERSAVHNGARHTRAAMASRFINSQLAPGSIEVEETMPDADERAQMLLVHGEVTAAIEELQHAIDEAPHDVERWLLLFRIFRHQGMKNDYATLARSFKATHSGEEDWELVRNIGHRLDPENKLYHETANQRAEQEGKDQANLELLAPLHAAAEAAAPPVAAPPPAKPEPARPTLQHEPVLDFLGSSEPSANTPSVAPGRESQVEHIELDFGGLGMDDPADGLGSEADDKPGLNGISVDEADPDDLALDYNDSDHGDDDVPTLYAEEPLLEEVDFDPTVTPPNGRKKQ